MLADIGALDDGDINLAEAALALSAHYRPEKPMDQYHRHLEKITGDVAARFSDLIDKGADDDAQTRLAALKHILYDRENYQGDDKNYDDLDNADLTRVIDRRKGLPIAIALLYIHTGRALGWQVDGLNFPGHVLARIEHDGTRLIFDPFHACGLMQAPDLRALLKSTMGPHAELSVSYYETASNRDLLLRLQNNIKLRQIEAEDYAGALTTVDAMRALAPGETRLLFDAGILNAKTGHPRAAIEALEAYRQSPLSPRERQEVDVLLHELRNTIN